MSKESCFSDDELKSGVSLLMKPKQLNLRYNIFRYVFDLDTFVFL